MTKLKVLTFPFHQPYQLELFKTGHEFHVVDGFDGNYWNKRGSAIQSNERDLPTNARLVPDSELDVSYYDVVILPTVEYIRGFYGKDTGDTRIVNCHATMFPLPADIAHSVDSIVQTCTNLVPLREKDVFIPHGHDPDEFRYYNTDEEKEMIIHPINRFMEIGNAVTGYENKAVLDMIPEIVTVGHNPVWEKTDKRAISPDYKTYKFILNCSEVGFQLSRYKARSFTTSEMMLSEVIPVTANESYIFPKGMRTFIEDGVNGIVADSVFDFVNKYHRLMMSPKNERRRIRENARQTIIREQSLEQFIDNWNTVLEGVA